MKSFLFLLAATLLSGTGASAQSLALAANAQEQLGASALQATTPGARTWVLPRGGSVTYFEASSSHDAQHAQFAQLRQTFEALMPTMVLFEGGGAGPEATEAASIASMGAAGHVRFLAQQHHVPTKLLDNEAAIYEQLRTRTDAEQLKLYYLLLAVQHLPQQPHVPRELAVGAMQQLLANSYAFVPGTEHVIRNLAEFKAAYRKHCPAGGRWWKAPATYFEEGASAASVPYPFLREITTARAELRQRYQISQLAAHDQAGQRVLVVLMPGHAPALALGSGEFSRK